MISVVVRAERGVEALAATLRAIVPAVAEGLVGDAVVLDPASDDAVAAVADAVGATLVAGPDVSWRRGAQAARREWILCLGAGDVPGEGWILALDQFFAASPPDCGFGRLRRPTSWFARMRGLAGAQQVRAGDLLRRDLLLRSDVPPGRPARVLAAIDRYPVLR